MLLPKPSLFHQQRYYETTFSVVKEKNVVFKKHHVFP